MSKSQRLLLSFYM